MTVTVPSGRVVVATHNAGKRDEIAALLSATGLALETAADHGLPEPQETEESFAGNARIKARAARDATGLAALADDSGLEVDALGGAPGVHSADWAETPHGRDFGVAMQQVLEKLEESGQVQPWGARFRCIFVLALPDGGEEVFDGARDGTIVWPPRGSGGHGYDPIFQPEGFEKTFAEMTGPEKNALSHRAAAAAALVTALGG